MTTTIIKTIAPSGGDYTSIKSAWAGEQAIRSDLVARDEKLVFEIAAGTYTDTGSGLLTGFVTDSLRHIVIRPQLGAEHNGVNNGGVELTSSSESAPLRIRASFTRVYDIRVVHPLSSNNRDGAGIYLDETSGSIVERCIIDLSGNTTGTGISTWYATGSGYLNCLVIGGSWGVFLNGNRAHFAKNCTFVGQNDLGANASGPNSIVNCVFFDSPSPGNVTADDGRINYNASDVYHGGLGSNSISGITAAAFVYYANGDYRPAVGGALDGAGADLSAEFTDDITGATRTQWDIGAFGIISGSTTPTLSTPTATAVTSNSISFSIPVTY